MTGDSGAAGGAGLRLAARAEGAFLALAAGDALGWPQEVPRRVRAPHPLPPRGVRFTQWIRRGGDRFRPYDEVIGPGEYSDDTQLALAVARSRAVHGSAWWNALTEAELPLWTLYERGGGGATRRAARAWSRGRAPWEWPRREEVARYFDAGGNGVAMRVLPHAVFLAAAKEEEVARDAVRDGSATHGHPRALVGASAYACAAWFLLNLRKPLAFGELLEALLDRASCWGRFPDSASEWGSWHGAAAAANADYEASWRGVVEEMCSLLETARVGIRDAPLSNDRVVLETLGCFGKEKGSGTISAAAAAYLASQYAANPVPGVLRAAFEPHADTDTLAAMVGGLLGCLAGSDWLPGEWLGVQDAKYIRDLAVRVASGPGQAAHAPVVPAPRPEAVLDALLRNGDEDLEMGDALRARVTNWNGVRPVTRSLRVQSWRLLTAEGQTMYIHRLERVAPPKRARRTEAPANDAPGAGGESGRLPLPAARRAAPASGSSTAVMPGVVPETPAPFVVVRGLARKLASDLRRRGLDPEGIRCVPEGRMTNLVVDGICLAQVAAGERDALLRYTKHILEQGRLPPVVVEKAPVSATETVLRILVAEPELRPISVGLLVERRSEGGRYFSIVKDPAQHQTRFDLALPASLKFDTVDDAVSFLASLCSRMWG